MSRLKRNIYQSIPEVVTKKKRTSKKGSKLKKKDLVTFLVNSMTEEQWSIISQLRGLPIPETHTKSVSFLNGLFKKTISRAGAKGKGRNLQQWTCKMISNFTGLCWGKDEEIASREMGQAGTDVRMSINARRLFPFSLECKSGNQWNLPAAIKQCQANLYPDTEWMIVLDRPSVIKEERISPIVVVDGEVFFQILNRTGELVDLIRRNNGKD